MQIAHLSSSTVQTIERKQAHPSNILPVTHAPRRMAQQVPTSAPQAPTTRQDPVYGRTLQLATPSSPTSRPPSSRTLPRTTAVPQLPSHDGLKARCSQNPAAPPTTVPGCGRDRQSPSTTRPDSSQNSSSKQWKAPHSDPNTPSPSHSNTTSPASSASPQTPLNLETDSARIHGVDASSPFTFVSDAPSIHPLKGQKFAFAWPSKY
ncbi:hypothetical protein DFP72DRAFT_1066859 [Ephemerocybe angulata]|uniref:Uncharacterized protein n=1 Tax=Ephemerocybe angulata TaxID=980116 RepID=A0A8H6I081_9AGAR|nr:hypothetical protein DFP72DRAFT_1066859 [Tulosesus angulatus]